MPRACISGPSMAHMRRAAGLQGGLGVERAVPDSPLGSYKSPRQANGAATCRKAPVRRDIQNKKGAMLNRLKCPQKRVPTRDFRRVLAGLASGGPGVNLYQRALRIVRRGERAWRPRDDPVAETSGGRAMEEKNAASRGLDSGSQNSRNVTLEASENGNEFWRKVS